MRRRFNPLHCGAVVASDWIGRGGPRPPRFNPLHCGAVVASHADARRGDARRLVSIPFIAGQWSLRPASEEAGKGRVRRFNPLHCGAVVASVADGAADVGRGGFQSPSLRGSGRFVALNVRPLGPDGRVSIPFIAGQWSLRGPRGGPHARLRVSIPFIAGQWSLLDDPRTPPPCHTAVSIPFIAGQWSLLRGPGRPLPPAIRFNPLHCGAVVASQREIEARREAEVFQSPSLRGSGRFPVHGVRGPPRRRVSIPFIAGQWSLRTTDEDLLVGVDMFQSPSLRGSGRFEARCAVAQTVSEFQSPSLRGSGRFLGTL